MNFKIILTLAMIIIIANVVKGQKTFKVFPNDSIVQNIDFNKKTVLNFQIKHLGNDTLYLKWNKLFTQLPNNWEASICDYGTCYSDLKDSGTMLPVYPGDDGLLSLHITALQKEGRAIFRYVIQHFKSNLSLQSDTLTWVIDSKFNSIKSENQPKSLLITVEGGKIVLANLNNQIQTIRLITILGKEIFSTQTSNSNYSIPLENLKSGYFLIQIIGIDGIKNKIQNFKIFIQ